jgi:hypothetical protein
MQRLLMVPSYNATHNAGLTLPSLSQFSHLNVFHLRVKVRSHACRSFRQPCHPDVPTVWKSWNPQPPGALGAYLGLYCDSLTFRYSVHVSVRLYSRTAEWFSTKDNCRWFLRNITKSSVLAKICKKRGGTSIEYLYLRNQQASGKRNKYLIQRT